MMCGPLVHQLECVVVVVGAAGGRIIAATHIVASVFRNTIVSQFCIL